MSKSVFIQSIGTAVPAHKISQELQYSIIESANGMNREEKLRLKKIYSNSGVQYRHSVLDDFDKEDQSENILFHPGNYHPSVPISRRMELFELHAADLCEKAARNCLEQLPSLSPSCITHLITFSCTGMHAPGVDVQLVEKLKLQRNIERTCINFMGCYAGINALKTAYHIARSEPNAVILVAGVELCSIHYQKSEKPDQVVANALFSDGASAAIVSTEKIEKEKTAVDLLIQNFYAEFDPIGNREMVWSIGDFGFDLRLSAQVPELIKNDIHALIEKLFQKAGISQPDITYYAMHPGGTKILEACEQALTITKEQNKIAYDVLRNYGNMSSVTIFFVLQEYLKSLVKADAGKKMLVCAFGPGLTMESMILEIQ